MGSLRKGIIKGGVVNGQGKNVSGDSKKKRQIVLENTKVKTELFPVKAGGT